MRRDEVNEREPETATVAKTPALARRAALFSSFGRKPCRG